MNITQVFYLTFFFVYTLLFGNALGQVVSENTEQTGKYDPSQSYCFRFTWLGPEFNNATVVNTTCNEYIDNIRTNSVPCRQPLLVTDNGAPPDINYLWETHRDKVLCRQAQGQVCAKYSYSFSNQIQNVTYMCVKVSTPGKGAVRSGCYKQTLHERDVEMCVCESSPGPGKPCNASDRIVVSLGLIISLLFFVNILK
ncbi:hypothetical protein RN001_003219 [Aquatica leii]|uniref:Uncharacterized protein n=1 Tax=Aquatica leii TaxID=1421715 RepID=A0AAN7SRI5_9COLE|nr:hypothetical protein RN001_003219 [Aquatica leii]